MALPNLPGLEARFVWKGPIGDFVINDQIANPPRAFLRTIGGWRSTADAELPAEKNMAQEGERPRFGLRAGKTLTFEGKIEAKSAAQCRSFADDMLAGFWETTQEYVMEIQVRTAGAWVTIFTFNARAISVDSPEAQTVGPNRGTYGWERGYVITLRMGIPKFYSTQEVNVQTGAVVVGSTGIIPPFTPPILLPASATGASVDVLNEGGAPADPLLRIWGPVSDPVVTNDDLPASLSFPGVQLANGQWLDVDFVTRQVLLEGQSDFRRFLRGGWWDRGVPGLPPKATSTIRLSGTTISDPAKVQVIFKPPRY